MSSEDSNLVDRAILDEWDQICADPQMYIDWQYDCRVNEPLAFIAYWEQYVRKALWNVGKEAPLAMASPGFMRTLADTLERTVLMGFFLGVRRFAASLAAMDPMLAEGVKPTPPELDTGGFLSTDFSL